MKSNLKCVSGCLDPHGNAIYMDKGEQRLMILEKEMRDTFVCPACRRWSFGRL